MSWGHGLVEVAAVARVVPGHLSPLLAVSLPGRAEASKQGVLKLVKCFDFILCFEP